MSFLKLTGGKLITGLTLVSAVEGALVVHNKYKTAMIERKEEFSRNHGIKPQINNTVSNTIQEQVQTVVTDNSQSKTAATSISDSFNYLLWGDSKNISIAKPTKFVETGIQHENQGWLDWILWGSKDFIKQQVIEKNDINEITVNTLSPTVMLVEESNQNDIVSWYNYFLDSSLYIHDKLEPVLGTGLFYLELFVIGNLLMVCLCFFLVDLLIIIKFLELIKKVIIGLYNLFFKI